MRRLKPLMQPVVSAFIAFTTLTLAALFATKSSRGAEAPEVRAHEASRRPRFTRKLSRVHAVPLVALLAIGATAFAVGSEASPTPDSNAAGTAVHHRAPATTEATTSTTASTTTQSPTTTAAPTTTVAPPTTVPPTTAAPVTQPPATQPPAPQPAPQPVSVHGACGGNLPPCCIMMRESGGDPSAVNPSSGASGKWQFMPDTWANYGGYPTAASAPEWVQDQRAAQVWAGGAGAGHWGGGC